MALPGENSFRDRYSQPTAGASAVPAVLNYPSNWRDMSPVDKQRWMERNPARSYREAPTAPPAGAIPIVGPDATGETPEPLPVLPSVVLPAPQAPQQQRGLTITPYPTIPFGGSNGSSNRDALARLKMLFQQYGLADTLGDWAWEQLQNGAGESEVTLSLYDRPEFKRRFPAIEARVKKGLAPLSPAEYVEYERRYRQMMQASGLPPSFYDQPEDVQGFLEDDVSLNELQARIQGGYDAVKGAPKEVREAFASFFGADSDAALASFVLDRSRALPALEKAIATAQAGGLGWRYGFSVDRGMADKIADYGRSASQVEQGFNTLQSLNPLFDETISETSDFKWDKEGADAVFGASQGAQRQLEGRVAQRSNAVGRSGAGSTERGVVGVTSVR